MHYQHTLKRLDAELHSGQISFAEYSHRIDQAREHMERAEHAAHRLEQGMDVMSTALATVGIAVGLDAAFDFAKESVEVADVAAQSFGRLQAVVMATGGSAGYSAQEMRELAKQTQAATDFGHVEVEQAEAILAMHKRIGKENFAPAVSGAGDIAAVLGTDLRSAAVQLGRALDDPTHGLAGLSRAGIVFEQSEREQIAAMVAAGDAAQAQAAILHKLQESIGGVAAAMRSDLTGAKHQWEDVQESIGGVVAKSGAVKNLSITLAALNRSMEGGEKNKGFWATLFDLSHESAMAQASAEATKRALESIAPKQSPVIDEGHIANLEKRDKLLESLREEIALWGTVGEAREVAKLAAAGVTAAELAETQATLRQVEALRANKAAHDEQLKHARDLQGGIESLTASLREQVATFGMSAEEARLWGMAQKGANDQQLWQARNLARQLADLRAEKDALEQTERKYKAAEEEAAKIKEEVATPSEKLADELVRLKQLREGGFLDRETYGRAVERARHESTGHAETGTREHGEQSTLLKGTAEAFHAIMQWTAGKSGRLEKQSLDELRKIRQALSRERKQEKQTAAASKKTAALAANPRLAAELDRRAARAERRKNPPLQGHENEALARRRRNDLLLSRQHAAKWRQDHGIDRTARGKQNTAIREAARNRLRLAAESRQRHGLTPKEGDRELLAELKAMRDELAALRRQGRNAAQPATLRRI